ncbi:MAG: hypothetical protein JWM57_2794 [Phycisphaerales bacterium]|nr:hypothetical protein [Phycisphaerales bacterium]
MKANLVRICRDTFRQRSADARPVVGLQAYVWRYLPTPVTCGCGHTAAHTDLIHSPSDPDRQNFIACPMCGDIVDPDYEDPDDVARELGLV